MRLRSGELGGTTMRLPCRSYKGGGSSICLLEPRHPKPLATKESKTAGIRLPDRWLRIGTVLGQRRRGENVLGPSRPRSPGDAFEVHREGWRSGDSRGLRAT